MHLSNCSDEKKLVWRIWVNLKGELFNKNPNQIFNKFHGAAEIDQPDEKLNKI